MPDLKISQLTGGGAAQATDEIPIARSGANFKITGANIAAAATTIGASVTQSGSALVNQADIGSAPNEIPLNQYLGTMAYQDAAAIDVGTVNATTLAGTLSTAAQANVTSVGTLTSLTVSGDLTVDTNTLYVDSVNNRVGIGTTSLSSKLEVQGQSVMARFKTGAAADGRIEFAYNTTDVGYLSVDSATEFSVVARIGNVLKLGAGGSERARIDASGNLGVGTATFGTSAAKVLAIGSGTEPSTSPADTIQLYSVDRSAGNTIPALRCEGTGVTDAGITDTTVTNKIAIKVNGTVYYLLATTNAT